MRTGLRRKNLTVAETMCLVAGAAVGLWRVKTAITLGFWDLSDWSSWYFAFYSTLAGVNMVTMLLLVVDRVRTRRPWRVGAILLFTFGMASWVWVTSAVTEFVGHWQFSDALLEGLPIVSFFVLLACLIGGRLRRWWVCRGWWAERMGTWMVAIWAVPGLLRLIGLLRLNL